MKTCVHGIYPQKLCKKCKGRNQEKKKMTDLAYYTRNRTRIIEKRRKYYHKIQNELNEKLNQIFGMVCIICNDQLPSKYLALHNIYNNNHPRDIRRFEYYISHRKEFIRICKFCHKTIHYLKKIPDLELLLKYVRDNN